VSGVIDENGKLQALRAVYVMGDKAEAAIGALARWQFAAAQLDGKAVASKVLIGVTFVSAEQPRDQNAVKSESSH